MKFKYNILTLVEEFKDKKEITINIERDGYIRFIGPEDSKWLAICKCFTLEFSWIHIKIYEFSRDIYINIVYDKEDEYETI